MVGKVDSCCDACELVGTAKQRVGEKLFRSVVLKMKVEQ